MTSGVLVDVNVAFAAVVAEHPFHRSAVEFFTAHADGSLRHAWPTELGVLRLLSNGAAMAGAPLSPTRALAAWSALEAATAMRGIDSAPPQHRRHLETLVAGRKASASIWTDAWLAALALSLDLELATFDGGFRSFGSLKLSLLTA